jgi:hypothetical protein
MPTQLGPLERANLNHWTIEKVQNFLSALHHRQNPLKHTPPEVPPDVIDHDDGKLKFSRNVGKPLTFDKAQTRKSNPHPRTPLLLSIIRREEIRVRILLFLLVARLPIHKPMCENIKNRLGRTADRFKLETKIKHKLYIERKCINTLA